MYFLYDPDEVGAVGQVAVVEDEAKVVLVGILIQVVDAGGVEQGRAAFDAVDFVAFLQKEFTEVGAVLTGDAGD